MPFSVQRVAKYCCVWNDLLFLFPRRQNSLREAVYLNWLVLFIGVYTYICNFLKTQDLKIWSKMKLKFCFLVALKCASFSMYWMVMSFMFSHAWHQEPGPEGSGQSQSESVAGEGYRHCVIWSHLTWTFHNGWVTHKSRCAARFS